VSRWGVCLTIVSMCLLLLAMSLFSFHVESTIPLWLMAVSLLMLLASVAVSGRAEQVAAWKVVRRILLVPLCIFPLYGYFAWLCYYHRQKPDTVGYAEFNGETTFVRLSLPEGWRFNYNQRHAPYFNQGRVHDDQGRLRLEAYLGSMQPGPQPLRLKDYARRTTEPYRKAGRELEGVEYRETPRGQSWVFRLRKPEGEPPFGNQPVLYVQYAEQEGDTVLFFDFRMLAAEAEELLPLTWQLVRTAEFRSSNQLSE
jgi:hypothetical protein